MINRRRLYLCSYCFTPHWAQSSSYPHIHLYKQSAFLSSLTFVEEDQTRMLGPGTSWHWSRGARSQRWCIRIQMIGEGTQSKYQTTTCGFLAHSNIPTKNITLHLWFSWFWAWELIKLWCWHRYYICFGYSFKFLLSWQRSWTMFERGLDIKDDHVKMSNLL